MSAQYIKLILGLYTCNITWLPKYTNTHKVNQMINHLHLNIQILPLIIIQKLCINIQQYTCQTKMLGYMYFKVSKKIYIVYM